MIINKYLHIVYITFKLKKEVNIEEFRSCAYKLDVKLLANKDGFASRKVLLPDDGHSWAELTFWKKPYTATTDSEKFMKAFVTKAYPDFVDLETIKTESSYAINRILRSVFSGE